MTCLLLSFNGATESLSENARTHPGKARREISTRRPSEGPWQKYCSRCDIVLLDPVQTIFMFSNIENLCTKKQLSFVRKSGVERQKRFVVCS